LGGNSTQLCEAGLQEIKTRASEWGILRAVYMISRLARELLEVAVPPDWLASIEPADFEERYHLLLACRSLPINITRVVRFFNQHTRRNFGD